MPRFIILLNEPVVHAAIWAAHFLFVWMWTLSSDLLCVSLGLPNFNVKRIDEGPWGREWLLSRCQTVGVMVPPCLPEQITSPNHLKGRNDSSRTAIYRHARWASHCLFIRKSRSSGVGHRVTSAISSASPSLVCLFESFLWCFFNLLPL